MNTNEKLLPAGSGHRCAFFFLFLACCLTAGNTAYAVLEEPILEETYQFDHFRKTLSDLSETEVSLSEADTANTLTDPSGTVSETENTTADFSGTISETEEILHSEAVSENETASELYLQFTGSEKVRPPYAENSAAAEGSPASTQTLLRTLKDYRELRSFTLPAQPQTIQTLESRLSSRIASYSGKWSVYVKNLFTDDSLILNDTPMKSASVMKLFIMGAVYDAIESKELERTQEIEDLMYNMICYSSNPDANRLLALLGNGSYEQGIEKVNQYIDREEFTGSTHEYNGFNDSSTILDSEHFNQVSAKDCGILLEQIYRRTFGSRTVCNEIEELMLNQNTRYKIPAGLPEGIAVGNKTGEMDTVENDAAVIYGEKSDYILCILSSDWDSKNEAITHIAELSSVVYDFFSEDSYYQNTAQYRIESDSTAGDTAGETISELRTQKETLP